jgi:hypothetical protein
LSAPSPRRAIGFSIKAASRTELPLIAATGELVGASRSLVPRLALAEGLRVLARRYGRE